MAVNPTAPAVEISSRAEARHLGELGFLHWVMTFEVDLAKGGRTDYVSRTMSDWPDLGWLETLETLHRRLDKMEMCHTAIDKAPYFIILKWCNPL